MHNPAAHNGGAVAGSRGMVSSPAFSLGSTEYSQVALKLPKLRLPEAPSTSSVLNIQASPRTPRRKIGRLNAGAALTFFTVPELSSAASYDPRGCSPSSSPSASPITSPVHPSLKVRGTFSQDNHPSVFLSGSHKSLNGQNHQRTTSAVHRSKLPTRTCARAQSSEGESDSRATRDGITTKEKSQMVNEELLLFFFQLDLGTRLQVGSCLQLVCILGHAACLASQDCSVEYHRDASGVLNNLES